MPQDPHQPVGEIRHLLDALNCGAALIARPGRIIHANPPLCRMFGKPKASLIDQDIRTLYPDEEARRFIERRLSDNAGAYEGEFWLPGSNGQRLPVIVSSRDLVCGDGRELLRVITVIDISLQKDAEQQALARNHELTKLSDVILQQAIDLKHQATALTQRVQARTAELREANMEAIYMLAEASEAKDSDTGQHVRRIQALTEALARKIGMSEDVAERFGYSAVLHDVGKMLIPDDILKKPGPLTPQERLAMQKHAEAGHRILSRKKFFRTARQIARSHHERWDGTGYPDGLAGESIPLAARIVALVDVFDALTSARAYKPAWPIEDVLNALREGSGSHFDPSLVTSLLELIGDGTIAKLTEQLKQHDKNRDASLQM
jgi:PAS domain S-box-containing protein/putative nucleotidyltransferase with HDIG domain